MLSDDSELRVDAEMSRINSAIAAIRTEFSRAETLDFELTLARCVRSAVNECAETEVIQSASQATLASSSPTHAQTASVLYNEIQLTYNRIKSADTDLAASLVRALGCQ